jgi:hypothetical protein
MNLWTPIYPLREFAGWLNYDANSLEFLMLEKREGENTERRKCRWREKEREKLCWVCFCFNC